MCNSETLTADYQTQMYFITPTRFRPSGLIFPSRYFLAPPRKHHRVDIQPSRHLLNLNAFLTAKLNGLYFKVCRILPGLSRIVVLGHKPPSLVRRRCPLKRGNYIFRVLVLVIRLLIQHIHPELWKSQGPRSLKLKPNF
jgi:hypothetical protein